MFNVHATMTVLLPTINLQLCIISSVHVIIAMLVMNTCSCITVHEPTNTYKISLFMCYSPNCNAWIWSVQNQTMNESVKWNKKKNINFLSHQIWINHGHVACTARHRTLLLHTANVPVGHAGIEHQIPHNARERKHEMQCNIILQTNNKISSWK